MKRLLSIALIAALIVSGTPLMGITLGSNNNGFAYAANTIPIDEEHFPDDYFRNQLTGWYGSSFDPATVTTLRMGYFNIASFEGLQYFTALETLDCSGNKLSSLDVSHNTKLKQLNCGSNSLVSLDVSHNTELETLQCFINKLSSLDVSHNKKLKNLYCDSNNLKSLDVSHNTVLETLHCECNELSSLDLSNNIRLNGLSCYRNKLSSLDISNTNLTNLQCENNNLSSLDVSHNTDLRDLNCSENNLSNLDVSHNTALTSLTCSNNKLSSLDISHNTALESFSCDNNNLGKLYVYDKLPKYSSYDDGVEIIYVEGHDDIDKGYITFHYISSASDDEGTAKVYYDNNYFTLSNDEYSHGLATASLGLSMAGFKREYVADFLKDCGFRNNIEQSDRYYTPLTNDEDKVAYTFATKEIDGDTVIAVVLRGGNYGNEWGSDGRVGHLQNVYGYHYAFNAAADDIINHLETYCDDNGIELYSIATKIWLTGYSRGAAVANCVGAKLEKNNLINKDNLYCYGLATPRTVTGEKVYKSAQGIYNVVNPLDVVPCVPLNSSTLVTIKTKSNILTTVQKPWNYTRHGETLELPSALMNLGYISQLNDMSKEFYEITGTAYLRFKGVLLQSLLDILATSTVSEKNYVVYIQDQFIVPALEKFMGEGITDDAALLSVLSTIPGTRKMLEEAGFIQKISGNTKRSVKSGGTENPIMMQHWPETYLSWMNTSVPKKPGFIKSIFVQCPVDVIV